MKKRILLIAAFVLAVACAKPANDKTHVVVETSAGAVMIELYADKAPVTVANFLRYVDAGAYDGAYFYRTTRPDNDPLITVIQGGLWAPWEDDMDQGFEAPFPAIVHETTETTGVSNSDGVISMARAEPGTAASEFFINVGDNPSLDFGGERNPDGQGFATFGRVIGGMDVVQSIHAAPALNGAGVAAQLLSEPVVITSIRREGE